MGRELQKACVRSLRGSGISLGGRGKLAKMFQKDKKWFRIDIESVLLKEGYLFEKSEPGSYCFDHPNDVQNSLIYRKKNKELFFQGSCCGLAWPRLTINPLTKED